MMLVFSLHCKASTERIPKLLEYGSCMTHLAFLGILRVLTRYLLQKLVGPGVAGWIVLDGVVRCCFQTRYHIGLHNWR
ncbi:hypothetical protein RchiOBHm_Chr5g0059171 [Rosa chinensis]|uniref:Uncharacterized protein n=1 Tax=Rosa chinensis TaxID=74649 RepID=A0A2P6QHD4_ROSCH|nr:hypothetical protein RchiOBHm_Chr5g0059171 [Rosa chinensis]